MRRFVLVAWAVFALALGQGVREAAMGGVILPGPDGAGRNPAFSAIEGAFGAGTYTLPLGALGLLLPDRSPLYALVAPDTFYRRFDLLSFLDQVGAPRTLLLNPARSPGEVVFELGADGVRITDGAGRALAFATGAGTVRRTGHVVPPPLFQVPFGLGPGLRGSAGIFLGTEGLSLSPNDGLRRLLNGSGAEPNQTYALTASGAASGGIVLDLTYAGALELPEAPGTLYLGARGRVFLGLARVDAGFTYRIVTDAEARPDRTETLSRTFYVLPGRGIGYGGQLDLGAAYAGDGWVVGVGVRNALGFARWQGTEVTQDAGGSNVTAKTVTRAGPDPALYLSGAGRLPLEEGGELLVAADLGYDGAPFGHLGAEYPVGSARIRAGIGYDRGLVLGTGAGLALGPLRLDLALTGQTSPWDGHLAFGLQAGVGF